MKAHTGNLALRILPRVAWAYLKLTALTSRLIVKGSEHPDRLKTTGTGFIYAFWHNQQIILPVIRKHDNIHCLISSSRDGEYITRVAALFGKQAIRGSSTRGGFEAMKQIMQVLGSGGIVAVTPDGPLGPKGEVKSGVVQVSRALNSPIVPIGFDASRKKIFNSWDKFILPIPFSSITIIFGEPLWIEESESDASACARLQKSLDLVTLQATQILSTV